MTKQMDLGHSPGAPRSVRIACGARAAGSALLLCGALFGCGEHVDVGEAALDADALQGALQGAMQGEQLAKTNGSAHAASRHAGFRHRGRHHHHHRRPRPPEEPTPAACDDALSLQEIAGADGEWLIGAAPPALANSGSLAFAATDATGVAHLLVASGGPISAVSLEADGLSLPVRVALDDEGHLGFVAATPSSDGLLGVFSTDTDGSSVVVHYAAEEGGGLGDDGSLITGRPFALAPNGTLAFSSIRNGAGALYRGAITGSLQVLRSGSGAFFNQQDLDVNATGTVAMQMEHNACGLQRGILLFDEPETDILDIDKAVAGLSVGTQPELALSDTGGIAFAFTGDAPTVPVLRCPEGEPVDRFTITNGVYTATRTPLSDAPDLLLIADNAGAFARFGSVDIDADGRVVFEAELAAGGRGIFKGPDPVLDKIVAVGDTLGGEVITEVQLGQLNDSCQLAFATNGASGRRVWRADGIAD